MLNLLSILHYSRRSPATASLSGDDRSERLIRDVEKKGQEKRYVSAFSVLRVY